MLARLIFVLALLTGTSHAPAMAHADPAVHHAHGEISLQVDVDHHEAPSSHDGAGDSVHHHYPATTCACASDLTLGTMTGSVMRPLARIAILSSRSQAPPTEPPAA